MATAAETPTRALLQSSCEAGLLKQADSPASMSSLPSRDDANEETSLISGGNGSNPSAAWSDQDRKCLEKLREMLPVPESELTANFDVLLLTIDYIRQLEAMLK